MEPSRPYSSKMEKKLKSDDYSRSGKGNLKESSKSVGVSNEKKNKEHNQDSREAYRVKSRVKSADVSLDDRTIKKLKPAEPGGTRGKTEAPLLMYKQDTRVYGRVLKVTRRPETDTSTWFTALPWEDTMKAAQQEGTLVLLQNLDPTYSSSEIEDTVRRSFGGTCTAKVLHCAATSSPHSGQAFVVFRTKQAALRVVEQLEEGCLMLSNGRPLIGHAAVGHVPRKSTSFPGHLFIDKLKFQMQKDKREAISTSHCSQGNTLEYEMAMEWRLLQEQTEFTRKKLLEKQGEELKKLRGNLI